MIGLVAAGLLAATSLMMSGCAASDPSPSPTLPSPVPSPSATPMGTVSPTGGASSTVSTPTPATPTLTSGLDAWAAYAAAWKGCSGGASGPVLVPASAVRVVGMAPVNACAALLLGMDGTLWVASPGGLSRFAASPVGVQAGAVFLAADPNGIWVTDTTDISALRLTFMRPAGNTSIPLPPRTIGIPAVQQSGPSLLLALDSGDYDEQTGDIGSPGADLVSVSQDGTARPLWSAPDSSIRAIAVDGTTVALAVGDQYGNGVSVVVGDGTHWAKTEVTADKQVFAFGIAVDGDVIVVTSQRTDDQVKAPVAAVTSISRDRGATWTSTETPYGGAGTLLGFHGGTALGDGMSEDLNQAGQRLVQLTEAGQWVPFDAFAALPPGGRAPFLVDCGLWSVERLDGGDDTILRYTPLPGPGC